MFCVHGLIKIYLLILTIIYFFNYSDSQINTLSRKYGIGNQINHFLQQKQTYEHKSISPSLKAVLSRKKEFRNQQRKFDNEILQHNIQLLNAQAKADVLKLQNSYLENYASSKTKEVDPSNSRNTERYPDDLRIRRDDNNDKSQGGEDNKELLHEIKDALDEIRADSGKHQHKFKFETHQMKPTEIDHKIGGTCHLNGTWKSDLIGIGFKITIPKLETTTCAATTNTTESSTGNTTTTTNTSTTPQPLPPPPTKENTTGDVELSIFAVTPTTTNDFKPVVNCSWNMFARIPFSSTTMLVINAEYPPSNHVAVFVGQCQYCDKGEMVVGQWILQKYAHDCSEVPTVNDVFGDVLKRQP